MKVSILIPCYNAERWIDAAIRSALGQTYQHKEVIVVDDGSTDGSLEIIRNYEGQIQWESGPNRGGNVTRNRLLELASGEWLQYLDADDYLSRAKIAEQVKFLEANGDADVVYAPVLMEYWNSTCTKVTQVETREVQVSDDPWTLLIRWRLPQTGSPLWRKRMVEAVGGWNEYQPCCQEAELYLRLLKHGARFVYFDHAGAVYRQWSQQTVCTKDPLLTITKRLELIDAAEQHLTATHSLTNEQLTALAITRLELARSLFSLDAQLARRLAEQASSSGKNLRLPAAPAFPASYRLAYRLLGFGGAEWLARSLRRRNQQPV